MPTTTVKAMTFRNDSCHQSIEKSYSFMCHLRNENMWKSFLIFEDQTCKLISETKTRPCKDDCYYHNDKTLIENSDFFLYATTQEMEICERASSYLRIKQKTIQDIWKGDSHPTEKDMTLKNGT